jgi:hypothetical protein
MVKYRVKEKVPHLIVDNKRLGPGDVFEQTEDYYERNKLFVEPVFPPRKLSEAEETKETKKDSKVDESADLTKSQSTGRVVRPGKKD